MLVTEAFESEDVREVREFSAAQFETREFMDDRPEIRRFAIERRLNNVALVEGPSTEREMHNIKEDLGNATGGFR
jgi:hypothetical protein